MMGLPLAFAESWLLFGLLVLPALWWLLRLIPPRPRRIDFPPTRLLFDIAPKEETPARTPWWLTALRLTAAALVIIAAAGPIWNPPGERVRSDGPLAILIDDGWSAAASWQARLRAADDLIADADNARRSVALIPLSETTRDISLQTAAAARVAVRQLAPKPYAVERVDTLPAVGRFLAGVSDAELVWLSDGVDSGRGPDFISGLARLAGDRRVTVYDGGTRPAHALVAAENSAAKMTVKVLRASGSGEAGVIRALDIRGAPLGEARFALGARERDTEASFELPVEIRNDIARLEIAGERSAGAVQLIDRRWRRRAVGVVSGASTDTAQPLLASTYYLARALAPFADVRLAERGAPGRAITGLIDQKLPMIVLADVGAIAPEAREQLAGWIERGGVLVRFAGPRLAAADDDLVPVRLRRGDRALGGSLTWEKPQSLALFATDGPFAGLAVPHDVTVTRQVLAEPDSNLTSRSWAMLADGTPLVTGERRGKGALVLFHVSADARWSNLPLSGTFVEMLRLIVEMAGTAETTPASGGETAQTLAPLRVLDGFGAFAPPPATARPLRSDARDRASPDHPPGFYGPPEGPLAVNVLASGDRIAELDYAPLSPRRAAYHNAEPRDLRGMLLTLALGLLAIDSLVVALLGGGLARRLRRRPASAMLVLAIAVAAMVMVTVMGAPQARAADDSAAIKTVSQTRLAYVITGNAEVDAIVKAGLGGLTLFLAQRTALEGGDPVGVDPARDELAFYPLIYWPVIPGAPKPPPAALEHIDAYMKQGGTVLFDTRDAGEVPPGGGESRTPAMATLRAMLSSLDVPELEPVPREHVLTKTFYLLRDFPGRFGTGQTWVEALPRETDDEMADRPARGGDGVSPLIITSNDLAGAWALRPDGQPMLPMSGSDPRQREFAFRSGVNIVMYTLTGNYKADQVHAPALIERLGQ
ncbi:MAG: DUF4159 domain-containing protein [Xanthobacteraceae bacterium]|nr:MAG: DUF4159 domain-containing protein [Xanthobacteraceae bacterium]